MLSLVLVQGKLPYGCLYNTETKKLWNYGPEKLLQLAQAWLQGLVLWWVEDQNPAHV